MILSGSNLVDAQPKFLNSINNQPIVAFSLGIGLGSKDLEEQLAKILAGELQ